jgi:putative acetyltransferase
LIVVRLEKTEDIDSIHHVNKQAFARDSEAMLVDKLRSHSVLTVSLVALQNNEIVGHIAFSPVTIEPEHSGFAAITMAPLAVLPAYQNKGAGSQLVRAGLEECRRLGCGLVFLVGHPDYYPRFGFIPAGPKGFKCEFEVPDNAWMVLELREGASAGRQGTVRFRPEFREAI